MSRGYLLDTNVLSATAPDRRAMPEPGKARARRWIEDHAEHLWLPIVAVGEIAAGIGKREGAGATRHAAELAEWLSRVLAFYPERIMPFGLQEALQLRQLARAARNSGVEIGFADMMVASIAISAGLVVATRNEKHFAAMGVAQVDPFAWEGSAA
jgi:predicted nucleic acid-binding protein